MGDFKCQTCEKSFANKQNLKRHYIKEHDGVIPADFAEIQNKKYECPDCHMMVCHLTKHRQRGDCKATKIKPKKPLSARAEVAQVRSAIEADRAASSAEHQQPEVEQPSPVKQRRMTSDIPPEDKEIITLFTKWGVDTEELAESTMEKYVDRVKNYLRYCYAEIPSFSLAGYMKPFLDPEHNTPPSLLPKFEAWFAQQKKLDVRGLAINAFIKLVDYLKWRFVENGPSNVQMNNCYPMLTMARETAARWNKTTGKKIALKKPIQDMDNIDHVTQSELLAYKEEYNDSEERKRYLNELKDMENATKHFTPQQIRDFLAFEVYISSGGMRPDVVRNLTLHEFSQKKMVELEGKEDVVCVEVAKHKTAKKYGPSQLMMDQRLYALVRKFVKVVRPQITGQESTADQHAKLVFCRQSGQRLDRLSCDNFKRWAKVTREMRTYDFRHMYAGEAVKNLDRDTAATVAHAHGHSEAIRDNVYTKRDIQRAQWAENRRKIRGKGGDQHLPSASESDSSDDEFMESFHLQYQADKGAEAKRAEKEQVHMDTPRQAFSSLEREIILDAFKDFDRGNISTDVYNEALNTHRAFSRLVAHHLTLPSRRKKNGTKSHEEVKEQVKNSWRSEWRKNHK